MMNRRAFLVAAAGGLAPLVAAAQSQRKTTRIGILGGSGFLGGREPNNNPFLETFRDGMRSRGYVEGRDYVLEVRWAHGDPERARMLAAELIGLNVDLVITQGSEATQAARRATMSIPIVFSGPSYPVEEGLIASFARPGGNLTGITAAMSDTVSKHLQLLRDVVPTLTDVAVIVSPANPGHMFALRETERAGVGMRLKIRPVPMTSADDANTVLATITRQKPGALIVQPRVGLPLDVVRRIAELAVKLLIPSITTFKALAEQGLLMSYGPELRDAPRQVAGYVDRILKGAKPADLPVERPTKFELVINERTARALGLTVPQSLLLRADEVIR